MDDKRFFLKAEYITQATVQLTDAEHHHLSRVMRLQERDEVELVNGQGDVAKAKIIHIDKKSSTLILLDVQKEPSPKFRIALGIPFMRPSKLEWILEKGTELGADDFYLYRADASTQHSLGEHQIERFRMIAISALKQSRRLFLPSLEILPRLESLLSMNIKIFFGDPRAENKQLPHPITESILFITGPESGFSESEHALLQQKGIGARINPHVLRAETAPIAALSILYHL